MSDPPGEKRTPRRARTKKVRQEELEALSKEELFAKLNASAQKTLDALMKAYEAGAKAGFGQGEEDQLIEILRRAKHLRDEVQRATQQGPPAAA